MRSPRELMEEGVAAKVSKTSVRLAIEGGEPVRSSTLPYGKQSIDESDIEAVVKTLRSDWITRGPAVDAFERGLAEISEMPYAISFSSATAALHAVMALVGAGPGKRVVTTPYTFAATSNSVLYCQGEVDFQDVEATTFNLDAKNLKRLEGAVAVCSVDFAGNPCDYDALLALKQKFGFRLINDASHSLGAFYQGKPVGAWADLSIYSFHPVKPITTGEGGAVVTRSKEDAEFLRAFRSHGIDRSDNRPGFYRQELLGFNYNMTDLQAALGLSQLKKLCAFTSKRSDIAAAYDKFFAKYDGLIETPTVTKNAKSSWHLYPLRLCLESLKVDRDAFLKALMKEGIGANVHYIPVHLHPFYQRMGFAAGLCPVAEAQYLREISLPVFPAMTQADVRDVCLSVEKCLSAYAR